ncbi:MAG: adenine phosphoribosyltransferase [Flavobacteriales bacterium]
MLENRIKETIVDVPDFPQKGVVFKDITPVFLDAQLCNDIVDAFVEKAKGKVDVVCGIESRGFLFGMGVANKLEVPFVLIRKAGKLPGETVSQKYDLEYGTAEIEMNKQYIKKGQRVLIHDDVLATGGTAEACAELVKKVGAIPVQFSFLAAIEFLNGDKKIQKYTEDRISLIHY